MGVKTKLFGPPAWRFKEFIASVTDHVMSQARQSKDTHKFHRAQTLFRHFLSYTAFAIPCIYCRVSYAEFITQRLQVERYLTLENGAKRLVYDLHNLVSEKLYVQDRKEQERKKDPSGLNWRSRDFASEFVPPLTFEQALDTRFQSCSFQDITDWFGYIVFDYEPCRWPKVMEYFHLVAEIVGQLGSSSEHMSRSILEQMDKQKVIWTDSVLMQDTELRLRLVYNFELNGKEQPMFTEWYKKIVESKAVTCA